MAWTKIVYINDEEVWDHLSGLPNFSAWVRDKARAEIRKEIDPSMASYLSDLVRQYVGGIGAVVPIAPVTSPTGLSTEGWL